MSPLTPKFPSQIAFPPFFCFTTSDELAHVHSSPALPKNQTISPFCSGPALLLFQFSNWKRFYHRPAYASFAGSVTFFFRKNCRVIIHFEWPDRFSEPCCKSRYATDSFIPSGVPFWPWPVMRIGVFWRSFVRVTVLSRTVTAESRLPVKSTCTVCSASPAGLTRSAVERRSKRPSC